MRSTTLKRPDLRIATYNIEWFTTLFSKDDQLLLDDARSARYKVSRAQQAKAIAQVLSLIDADIIMIIEAPNTGEGQSSTRALENFARHFGLRQNVAISGFESHTDQEITALYDPDVIEVRHDPVGKVSDGTSVVRAPRFDGKYKHKLVVENQPDVHRFSKPPLELALTHKPSGKSLRLIGVHAKSKAVHGARDDQDRTEIAIRNRSKQLAQCLWIRERVEDHMINGEPVIVLGDFNDGPHLDALEELFGLSGVEVILGKADTPQTYMMDPHARLWLDPMQGWALSSARFYHASLKWYVNTLLDYVMLSPDLVINHTCGWHIFHPFDDPKCFTNRKLQNALLTASDHFPVIVDIGL